MNGCHLKCTFSGLSFRDLFRGVLSCRPSCDGLHGDDDVSHGRVCLEINEYQDTLLNNKNFDTVCFKEKKLIAIHTVVAFVVFVMMSLLVVSLFACKKRKMHLEMSVEL